MTAEEFVKKDLGSNIAKGDRLQNIHYTADEWLDVMDRYAQYKAENLPISDVSGSLQICAQPKCYNKPKNGSCFCKHHGNNR